MSESITYVTMLAVSLVLFTIVGSLVALFVAGWRGRSRFGPVAAGGRPVLVNKRRCVSHDCGCENPQQANFCRRCGRSLWVPDEHGGTDDARPKSSRVQVAGVRGVR